LPLLVLLPLSGRAAAQQAAGHPTPGTADRFDVQGSASVGYRVTDVSGRPEKYRELFNLSDGLRLVDFNLFAQARPGASSFADTFAVSASGLGGDPDSAIQLTARKQGRYDFRADWRRSAYVWDQSDAALPDGFNGLTASHRWDTVHTFGTADLLLHVTDHLRAGFDFGRTSRSGMTVTTRSLDYFGAPDAWGSFTRANPYLMAAPLDEDTNRYTAGFDYTRARWTLHYHAGYQTFTDAVTADALDAPETSLNVDDPITAQEVLQRGAYQDSRRLRTPMSTLAYDGTLAPRLTWRGGYTFFRSSGPAALDAAYDGTARSGSSVAPYTLSLDTRATVTEPVHVIDQGLTYEATDRVSLLVDYRYTHVGIDSKADFDSLAGPVASQGETTNRWRESRHQIDADVEIMPSDAWLVRAGVTLVGNDVRTLTDGVPDPTTSTHGHTVWPTASLSYKPSSIISVRADVDAISRDVSYTRITPETDVGSRVTVHLQPTDQLAIVETLTVRNATLDATDYRSTVRSDAVMGTYTLNERLALSGGWSYDNAHVIGSAAFLRGTPPLDVTIDDRAIDTVWQAGFTFKPTSRLSLDAAGTYVRTTGTGTIMGEAPEYGPLTFPYLTGTVSYAFPRLGRLSIDLERTYYIEELVTANNFGARMLMVRWTRAF
jgi:hypothetical protein